MRVGRMMRIDAATSLLIGGLVHLQLYFDGYRHIDKIGPSFLLNAIASGVLAAAVAVRRDVVVKVAAMGLAAGTIVAFILSRQGDGLFDFREEGFEPSPQAVIALIVEILAIVTLAVSMIPSVAAQDSDVPLMPVAPIAFGASAVVLVGCGIYWANTSDDGNVAGDAAGPAAVAIADFAFAPTPLTVEAGTTVMWTNADSTGHSVVAEDLSFQSDRLDTGATFEFEFDTAGDYPYVCGIHPNMSGVITVTD